MAPGNVTAFTSQICRQYHFCCSRMGEVCTNGTTPPSEAAMRLMLRSGYELTASKLASPSLAASWLWEQKKQIYFFDSALADSLIAQAEEFNADIMCPVEVLERLSSDCFYIQVPEKIANEIDGCFVWKEGNPSLTLHFLYLHSDGKTNIGCALALKNDKLSSCLPEPDAFLFPHIIAAANGNPYSLELVLGHIHADTPTPILSHNLILRTLQLVQYLCCDNAEVQPSDAPEVDIQKYEVGTQIGDKLRQAADCRNGSPRQAHIRKGHWHHYWIGPKNGDRKRVPRWIPPILVGADKEDGISVTPVK